MNPESKTGTGAIAVLFVGDAEWPEFREAYRWLAEHTLLRAAPSLEAALDIAADEPFDPELIVLAQAWPGQFGGEQLERLRRQAPLARISEILGSWCEGETLSGQPIAGAIRHYWHQWLARLEPEFERAAAGDCPVWGLPVTATDEERLLALPSASQVRNRGLLTIHTRRAETATALCEAAASRGFSAIWARARRTAYVSGVRAAIWDAGRDPTALERELADWRGAIGNAPVVALVDFPRVDDRDRYRAAGAALVVSKPFWLDDLFGQIARLLEA